MIGLACCNKICLWHYKTVRAALGVHLSGLTTDDNYECVEGVQSHQHIHVEISSMCNPTNEAVHCSY